MPAPEKNQNAAKPDGERRDKFLHVPCLPAEYTRWVRTANMRRMKLSVWVREKLNAASGQ
jgi:hypothetical protein